jgi:very-short-patch-repair endonuclease
MRNKENYFSLPFNSELRERARELRRAGNLCEVIMWKQFHKKKFKGYDFDRQKIIGNYIVDFYCVDCGVVIEIDGKSHDGVGKEIYDGDRNNYMINLGLTVIRIKAYDVLNNLRDVMEMLNEHPALNKPAIFN